MAYNLNAGNRGAQPQDATSRHDPMNPNSGMGGMGEMGGMGDSDNNKERMGRMSDQMGMGGKDDMGMDNSKNMGDDSYGGGMQNKMGGGRNQNKMDDTRHDPRTGGRTGGVGDQSESMGDKVKGAFGDLKSKVTGEDKGGSRAHKRGDQMDSGMGKMSNEGY